MQPSITPVYSYTLTYEGDTAILSYRKTAVSLGIIAPLCLATAIPAALIAAGSSLSWFVVWPLTRLLSAWALATLINFLRRQTPVIVKLGKAAIASQGKTYELDHVSQFILKNPQGVPTSTSNTVLRYNPRPVAGGVTAVAAGIGNVTREAGQAIFQSFSNVSYGSEDIAKGLGETDAEVLFSKITKMAGYPRSV